jgi:hypothetical protein
MNDDEELPPIPAYASELEEGEIREFKSLVKNPDTIPLPLSPSESPNLPPTPTPTPNQTPELIPQPAPILETFEIEPISFCGCSRRRRKRSLLDLLYALL